MGLWKVLPQDVLHWRKNTKYIKNNTHAVKQQNLCWHCRTHPPKAFPGSGYSWVLKLDQYAVDGSTFHPDWMSAEQPTEKAHHKQVSTTQHLLPVSNFARLVDSTYTHVSSHMLHSA